MLNDNIISISVVMPIYNEQENIIFAVEKIMAETSKFKKLELIIVDDGSNDTSNQKLIDLSIKYKNLIIIKHDKNKGLSQSLKDGFNKANNDYIVFNSADLPLEPKDISLVVEQKYPFDLLVIERNKYNGATLWRKMVSFCNRVILHIFFPLSLIDIADSNFTFIFKKEILKNIFPKSKSVGFIQPEIILRAKYLKFDIKTIETNYNGRKFGKSHFGKTKDILLTIFDIIKFRIYSYILMFIKE